MYPSSPHSQDQPILDVRNLSVLYGGIPAINGINFHLRVGERIAIVGPNGAGKSTLIKVIAGIIEPSSGEVKIFGSSPGIHVCIAYIPQRMQVDWRFPVTVEDAVMMGRIAKIGLFGIPKRLDWDIVHRALESVSLRNLAKQQIGQLSGGQQQRMLIARSLAQEADLLLLDEPLVGLDIPSQKEILDILVCLKDSGVTVIISTHDLNLAESYFDRVMLLNHQIIGFGDPAGVLTSDNLRIAYSNSFIRNNRIPYTLSDSCCGNDDVFNH